MANYTILPPKNKNSRSELPRIKISVELGTDERGKRRRAYKTVTLKSLSDRTIQKAIRDFEMEAASAKPVHMEHITYRQGVQKWFDNHVADLAYNTRRAYTMNIEPALVFFGDMPLSSIKTIHLLEYRKHLQKTNEKAVSFKWQVNSAMLKKMFQWQLMQTDLSGVPLPPAAKKSVKKRTFYSEEEIKQLLQVLPGVMKKHQLFVKTALYSGMRIGEIAGLTTGSVDFAQNVIHVQRTLTYNESSGEFFLGPTKSKTSRTITMPAPFMNELKLYVTAIKKQRLSAGPAWAGTMDLIFCKADGSPQHPASFARSFQDLLKRHQLKRITFHDLRHTHASLLLAKGVNFKVIQERLGHASIKLTLDTYSHITKELEREAAALLADLEA